LYDTFGICQNFVVPEPEDAPTFILQECSPALISTAACMLRPVGFDNQTVLRASEIDDELA